MLEIKNLQACYEDVQVLKKLNLQLGKGEKHLIMGPNGAGKSSLSKVLAGDADITISSGEVIYNTEDILDLDPEVRAHKGMFFGFQQPPEIPGVNNKSLLLDAYNEILKANGKDIISSKDFDQRLDVLRSMYHLEDMKLLLDERNVNEGFSGGERKKNEIWQMIVLEPSCIWLDEPDSGLDVDALKFVCQALNLYHSTHPESILCIVSHNPKVGLLLKPDYVHIFHEGQIVATGDEKLIHQLENSSYQEIVHSCVR